MDESTIRILQKLIRQIPAQSLQTMLTKWAHFTRQQIMSLNFKLTKAVLTEDILVLCEVASRRLHNVSKQILAL